MILHFTAWRQIYQNDPLKIMADQGIQITDELKKLVQGQEVALWSEQVVSWLSMVWIRLTLNHWSLFLVPTG